MIISTVLEVLCTSTSEGVMDGMKRGGSGITLSNGLVPQAVSYHSPQIAILDDFVLVGAARTKQSAKLESSA